MKKLCGREEDHTALTSVQGMVMPSLQYSWYRCQAQLSTSSDRASGRVHKVLPAAGVDTE